jgi:hypothetical protein
MRATLILLHYLLLCQYLSARQQPYSDSVSHYYADTNKANARSANYFLVKFRHHPDAHVQSYGVVKVLTPLHYILQHAVTDSNVVYAYAANNNWKASSLLLHKLYSTGKVKLVAATTGKIITATVTLEEWPRFISQPEILFADAVRTAATETRINSADPTANAVNTAQQHYPLLKGTGIVVSLKEQLFDTTDIDLTGRYLPSLLAATTTDSHATIMATMIAGAGNSDTKGTGAAPAALLSSVNFESLLPEDSGYFSQGISLQNHSYGTGIENYYGIEAQAYDQQIHDTDTLLHIFSSGNIGDESDSTGLYSGLAGYANLSGTFKQAKNVLVVGGTDDSLHIPALSSGGPAYDGRVKPELVAYGIDGTSGAAAITSGVTALLQDAFKQLYGRLPSAALLKALLVNSAISSVPLSYRSGYGSLHALNALNTVYAKHWLHGQVQGQGQQGQGQGQGNSARFSITIPPDMQQLKVTLCWNDPPAVINSPKTLVNDLDLSVTDAQGVTTLPWILNSSRDSITLPPKRGRDTLNNIEQVTIDNPSAGAVQINVLGKIANSGNGQTAAQSFYIAYSWTPKKQFTWTNPGEREILLSGSPVPLPLRWQSNITGQGDISASFDKGQTWASIATNINIKQGLYYWTVPDTFCTALLKFTTTDSVYVSDTFYLSPRLNLFTGYSCGDSALIYWQHQQQAALYQVYRMSTQYLQNYTQTTDTVLAFHNDALPDNASPYFAVSPIHKDGWVGLKSDGTNYLVQGTNCYFRNLLATLNDNGSVLLQLSLGTTYQLEQITWEKLNGKGSQTSTPSFQTLSQQATTSATDYTYVDPQPTAGVNYYRVKLTTSTGQTIYSDPVPVYLLNSRQYLLYPNPVYTSLNILSDVPDNQELRLYDMNGKLVLDKTFYDTPSAFDLSGLPLGVYECVILKEGKKVFTQKIIRL